MQFLAKFTAGLLALAGLFGAGVHAHAQDFRDNFPPQYADTPLGVNLQSGRFSYWLFSFAMGPFVTERGFNKSGFPFVGSIYWHSVMTATGASQPQIAVNLGNPSVSLGNPPESVQINARRVSNSWLRGTGSTTLEFYPNGTGGSYIWWSTSSVGWRLSRTGAGHTLVDKSGNSYFFEDYMSSGGYLTPQGRLTLLTNADGSTISFSYDASGRLLFMSSNRGYAVRYEYLSGGAQVKVCGFNLAQTYATAATPCSASNYVVTINNTIRTDGLLQPTSVVDLMGQMTNISWGGYSNNFPTCISLPNSATCEVTNSFGAQPGELEELTKKDQVRVQTDANGNTYIYGYDFPLSNSDDPPKQPGGPPIQSTSWINGPGYSAQAYYEDGLAKTVSAPGGGPVAFEYDGVNLKKATWPEGNNLTITRDWLGNPMTVLITPKPNSSETPATTTQTFPAPNLYGNPTVCAGSSDKLCDKPITRIDAKGNQTDFTYDPAHGGPLTVTLPAVQVNATGPMIRPQTRYEYAQRYAWIKNSGGTYVQAATPIWVLVRERSCKTTAASGQTCVGGAADEVITDYDFGPNSGPNNLLLRGVAVTAGGQTLRTCYAYDANGRKLSETAPMAGLAVCP